MLQTKKDRWHNCDRAFLPQETSAVMECEITISLEVFLVRIIWTFLFSWQGCQLFGTGIISPSSDLVIVLLNAIRDCGTAIKSCLKLGIVKSHERFVEDWWTSCIKGDLVSSPKRDSVNSQHACGQRRPTMAQWAGAECQTITYKSCGDYFKSNSALGLWCCWYFIFLMHTPISYYTVYSGILKTDADNLFTTGSATLTEQKGKITQEIILWKV